MSSVVPLPTAQNRTVMNPNRPARDEALPAGVARIPPPRRDALRERIEESQRERYSLLSRSPELALFMAMFATMPAKQRGKAGMVLRRMADRFPESEAVRDAELFALDVHLEARCHD